MNNLISYSTFLKERKNFLTAGTSQDQLNNLDVPSYSFFKLLFCFFNGDSDNNDYMTSSGGLLAPTWDVIGDDTKYYNYNSAWAYLKNNNEEERAEKLKQFIMLLSNINCDSPWYFSEVSGLGEVLNRLQTDNSVKFEDRKKITIKCLPDAFDQRIDTLLSLYRDVVWSWANKREVIPANLRKFDMCLYIWESPIYSLNSNSVLDEKSSEYSSSYKLLEFHNCEIDYNSIKTGYETLNNKEGFLKEFSIDIYFDDCYEHTYNSIMMRTIGDVIVTDTAKVIFNDSGDGELNVSSIAQGNPESYYNSDISKSFNELNNRINKSKDRPLNWFTNPITGTYEIGPDNSKINVGYQKVLPGHNGSNPITGTYEIGPDDSKINVGYQKVLPGHNGSNQSDSKFLSNVINETAGAISREMTSSLNRLFLGNLYSYSISKMSDQLSGVLNGQVFTAINTIDDYADTNIMNNMHNNSIGSLANDLQSSLNSNVQDRKNGRTNNSIKSLGSLANDLQSSLNSNVQDRKNGRTNNSIKSLGNLNKSKTLINNI